MSQPGIPRITGFENGVSEPCMRRLVEGTKYTWSCERCLETWVDRRETKWRPYVCRLNGTEDAA